MKRHTLILTAAIILILCCGFQFTRLSQAVPSAANFLSSQALPVQADESGQPLFAPMPIGEAKQVLFTFPDNAEGEMTTRTRQDQARDWLIYTIMSNSQLPADDINSILFDLPPVRYGYSSELGNLSYGPVRSVVLEDQNMVVLYPESTGAQAKDHIAYAADLQRMNLGLISQTIYPFTYRLSGDEETAQLTRQEPISGQEVFTPEYGYLEMPVTNLSDLESFMTEADDLVSVKESNGLVLGGRRLLSRDYKNIRVEDVAAIYQAISKQNAALKAFELKWGTRTYRTEYERQQLEEEMIAERVSLKLTDGTGFSLDPTYDYASLKSDLQSMELRSYFSNGINYDRALRALGEDDIVPLLQLLETIGENADIMQQFAGAFVESSIQENQFQSARYDGDLQGTEVGMILFYTDLIAKLWTIDYRNSSPTRYVPEFRNGLQDDLGTHYTAEGRAYPSARLWFGPNRRGFSKGDRQSMYFARNTSRIFAAGSNPLNPGAEVAVSAFFGAPLNWWNNHYEEVAEFEPMYEALNEIIKWSLAINFLNERSSNRLPMLNDVAVNQKHWFPEWVRKQDLKFNQWRSIDFYPEGAFGTSTETLPLLVSPPYRRRDGTEGYLQGGVSLARKDLLKSVRSVSSFNKPVLRRANLSSLSDNVVVLEKGPRIQIGNRAAGTVKPNVSIKPNASAKLRNAYSEVNSSQSFVRKLNQIGDETVFRTEMSGNPVGDLVISPTPEGFAAGFRSRSVDKGMAISRQASNSNNVSRSLANHPDVAQAVSSGRGQYLMKLKGENTYMLCESAAQPEIRISGEWAIRSSASKANSPTIRQRFVSTQEAQRLAKSWNKELPMDQGSWAGLRPANEIPLKGNANEVARRCLDNPNQGFQLKEKMRAFDREALATADEALTNPARYNEAAARLDAMAERLGETPEISFRRALADLGQPQLNTRKIGAEKLNRWAAQQETLRTGKNAVDIVKSMEHLSRADRNHLSTLAAEHLGGGKKFVVVDDVAMNSAGEATPLASLQSQAGGNTKYYFKQRAGLDNIDFNAAPDKVLAQVLELNPNAVARELPKQSLGNYRLQVEVETTRLATKESTLKLKYRPINSNRNEPCNDENNPNCNKRVFVIDLQEAS